MRIASTDALWQASAPGEAAPAPRASRPLVATSVKDAPDASYWTPYDYFMIEREARALRRAVLIATFTNMARRLRRLV